MRNFPPRIRWAGSAGRARDRAAARFLEPLSLGELQEALGLCPGGDHRDHLVDPGQPQESRDVFACYDGEATGQPTEWVVPAGNPPDPLHGPHRRRSRTYHPQGG